MEGAKPNASPEDILVGGQAVIEGVMMRTPHAYAVVVRRTDGSTVVKREAVRRLSEHWKPLSWPVIRGFAVLIQSLVLGIRALNFSFNVATAVHNWVVFNLVDGVIRVVFFLAYILLISAMKDIRRVFQYHGAEHKVVHTWEAGEALSVENARTKSTLHPRCGTSFLLFVMVVSIVVFSLFKFHGFWAIFLSRVLLIPLISGFSYELIRFSAPRCRRGFFRLVVLPGLALQRITTKEPSDDQLEVAILALGEALELDMIRARAAQAAA